MSRGVSQFYMCDSVKVDDECQRECHSSTCATVSRWMTSVNVSVTVLHVQQCQGG